MFFMMFYDFQHPFIVCFFFRNLALWKFTQLFFRRNLEQRREIYFTIEENSIKYVAKKIIYELK